MNIFTLKAIRLKFIDTYVNNYIIISSVSVTFSPIIIFKHYNLY